MAVRGGVAHVEGRRHRGHGARGPRRAGWRPRRGRRPSAIGSQPVRVRRTGVRQSGSSRSSRSAGAFGQMWPREKTSLGSGRTAVSMTQPCPVATTAAGSHKRACDCRRSSSSESSSSRGSLRRISRLRPVPVRPPAGARPCAGNPTAGDAVSVVVRRQVRGASSWGSGISRPAKAASTALRRYAAGSIPTSFALSSSE